MQAIYPRHLMDVDSLVKEFLVIREQSIITLHRMHFKTDNQISLLSLKEELIEELRTGCVTFINKNSPIEELNAYLLYIVNAYCKKVAKPLIKQKVEYICPGCLFLDKELSLLSFNKVFYCDECQSGVNITPDPKMQYLFATFSQHNKNGYHCLDCDRFIPHPLDNSSTVSCPYFDCLFVGPIMNLDKMHHPNSKSNPEKLILDARSDDLGSSSLKDSISSQEIDACTQLEVAEYLQDKLVIFQEIIETQSNNVPYSSSNSTIRHKQYVYKAFLNLLNQFPAELIGYLSNNNDSHMGFQHRIFQEYIRLLEESFPFFITKNKSIHKIDNLLDNSLCLFDGISVFDSFVTDKLSIKNGTKEFYIGGRKASYTKPFYIGKLLNIIRSDTKTSLMHLVKDYSFSKIRLRDIVPGTPVTVTHLRVPPHYQMGGMVYVNRVRKKIVERAKAIFQCQK